MVTSPGAVAVTVEVGQAAGGLTVLPAPAGAGELGSDPLAWLHRAQLAVGRIVEHGGFHELGVDLGVMDRSAGLSAVAEAVDLITGLARAERLRVDRLDHLSCHRPTLA